MNFFNMTKDIKETNIVRSSASLYLDRCHSLTKSRIAIWQHLRCCGSIDGLAT